MPVSLCDGEAYVVDKKEIERNWCLAFFKNGHAEDYLILYEDEQYKGMITYKSILQNQDFDKAIIVEKVFMGDSLWADARNLFLSGKVTDTVPVFDKNKEILYFARYNEKIANTWERLCALRRGVDKETWADFSCHTEHVHIIGINDVLFSLREWLIGVGTKVSVEGDGWSFWGIEEDECTEDDKVVIDEECKWVDFAYMEYLEYIRNYGMKLHKILCKPYEPDSRKKRKVMFYLAAFPYFIESIQPLICRYIQPFIECICIFHIDHIIMEGCKNIDDMFKTFEKLESVGAQCYDENVKGLFDNKYDICFLQSEYSGSVPLRLRKISQNVVAVQTTSIYTHMYLNSGKFKEVFSGESKESIDYLITSDYIADWICERDNSWEKKILRFGYPKLDALYAALHDEADIPENWSERTIGKRVYLFTTNDMKQSWLDFFADKNANRIAIWRPHPYNLDSIFVKCKIDEISDRYNVLIDDNPSYYASFKISDALISPLASSVAINYMYTGKPICLYSDNNLHDSSVIDYRNESWYKCAYSTSKEEEVLDFMTRIEYADSVMDEERIMYRKRVTSNFDGKVCDRIYDYFRQ